METRSYSQPKIENFPLVSVIIPAYNAEAFIIQTLESVISQTYQNLEIIVIDDGSQDSTADLVQSIMPKDDRIELIQQANGGVALARNTGIRAARGEFIAPIDADDIWFPERISKQIQYMSNPSVGLVYAWSVFIDETGELMSTCQTSLWEGNRYIPLIYNNILGNASSVLIRRDCLENIGGYDPSFKAQNAQGCEDWDLYLRLAECYEIRVVPEILVGYRQLTTSMSLNHSAMLKSANLVLEKVATRNPDIPCCLYRWSLSNFNWYLASKCSQLGKHRRALYYIKNALKLDYFPLLRPGLYRLSLFSILKIILEPVTSLIWSDHRDWLSFKGRIRNGFKKINPFWSPLNLAKLQKRQKKALKSFPWKQYQDFLSQRYTKISQNMLNGKGLSSSKNFPSHLDEPLSINK